MYEQSPTSPECPSGKPSAVLRSGRLVAWGNAVLAGRVSPDTAADQVQAGDGRHRLCNGTADSTTLPMFLAALRSSGVRGLMLVLPVPGDPSGLPGPAGFNASAIDAGEAVLTIAESPTGLVPFAVPPDPDGLPETLVRWQMQPISPRVGLDLLSLAEAERELATTVREVTTAVADLDLARWRPQLAAVLDGIRDGAGAPALAPGYPGRAHRVLALAQRLAAIADLVRTDPGGGAGTGSAAARDALLRPLATAARHATVAAFNSVVEPVVQPSSRP
ncbi:MAG TPA: hypothetical protein VHU88_23285 [Sporichthyaceae bacterium]|jgi:hypothetical protein|nr:hypothetical protein [Sporichthyaceae bacterium]